MSVILNFCRYNLPKSSLRVHDYVHVIEQDSAVGRYLYINPLFLAPETMVGLFLKYEDVSPTRVRGYKPYYRPVLHAAAVQIRQTCPLQ